MGKYLFSLLKMKAYLPAGRSKKSPSYKEEMLIKQGAEQFKKLRDIGIELPVVLL